MRLEHLLPEHVNKLLPNIQPQQKDAVEISSELIDAVGNYGPGIAVINGKEVIACMGMIDIASSKRAIVWALLAGGLRENAITVYRAAVKFLAQNKRRRLEMHIDPDFPEAARLAKMLKFNMEGTMECFANDGSDRQLWSRVEK